ncbi:hypothetical protein HAX54_049603 [Datura stramonium]|uniref:Uncharacterized protein n=1 Tax=Datura stramonium TaxID=4076 RepID=A0ABS8WPH8_DATST|nr:hypothetical protein [Datura stramonium]
MPREPPVETQVTVQGYRPMPQTCVSLAFHGLRPISIRDWGPFTIPKGPYFTELVWEFYASYRARKNIFKHRGQVDAMPYLPSMLVWGQEVTITPEAINSIYWAESIWPSLEFKRKVEDKENQFKWVAEIIARDQP